MQEPLIVSPSLLTEIENLPYTEQAQWLFLIQSETFKGYWEVQGLDSSFNLDFEDLIGSFNLVSPITVTEFLDQAKMLGYKVAFMEDPAEILRAFEYLKEIPEISLNSNLEGTVNGFLPWQITGYNKLIRDESLSGGFFVWTVGSGKTAAMTSAILHHQYNFDIALCVVKSHNKIDTQRKLKQLGNIDSVIIEGNKKQRQNQYTNIDKQSVLILNYEKIREDYEDIIPLISGRKVLFFWDEAPTKLANRGTQLYKATRKLIYQAFPNKPRASWMRHWALTATPIENSPEDVFSVSHLMTPGVLGTVGEFYKNYVATTDYYSGKPDSWKNLEAFEAKLQFMTHRVSKDDPQVKAMFPDVIDHPMTIDWNPHHLLLYNNLTGKAKDLFENELEDVNILALIQVLQMMCDAPSMIQTSANNRKQFDELLEKSNNLLPTVKGSEIALMLIEQLGADVFTNTGHTKLATWGEIITQRHPLEKIITHSTWAEYIFPVWEEYLTKLGVSYVVYNGTGKEKQAALDAFRNDPSIRCFLSGDAGSDSIDIAEASIGINYNIPWKWTTLKQREGRRDRVNSNYNQIYTYTLTMPFSVDERKMEICRKKFAFHEQLFDRKASDEALTSRLSREDLMYLLLG